ncbi:MAG TPA: response regulator transcription factor [Anaerolineales bacterium]|nr:response regulator transcription factor [Anaerolineales bacterium]
MEHVDVLVVDDEEMVARSIERTLRGHEFKITVANSGVQALQTARRKPPAIMLLDVNMPGMDGFAVCREVRSDPLLSDTPILFLTARSRDEEKIAGFRAGADDYLTKPFNIDELLMRVRAILRRSSPKADLASAVAAVDTHLIKVQNYVLDTRAYKLNGPRGEIQLTPVQYDLLYHLMSHPGQIFSPNRLLQEVWDYPSDAGSPDLVRVHVKNLRERVEADPRNPTFIRTVPGHGYMVAAE